MHKTHNYILSNFESVHLGQGSHIVHKEIIILHRVSPKLLITWTALTSASLSLSPPPLQRTLSRMSL